MNTDAERLDLVQRCGVTLGPAPDPCKAGTWYAYLPGLAMVEGGTAREALDRLADACRSARPGVDVVEDQARLHREVE